MLANISQLESLQSAHGHSDMNGSSMSVFNTTEMPWHVTHEILNKLQKEFNDVTAQITLMSNDGSYDAAGFLQTDITPFKNRLTRMFIELSKLKEEFYGFEWLHSRPAKKH